MMTLQEVLEFIENNIDLEHLEKARNRLIKIMNFEDVDRIPVRTLFPIKEYSGYSYLEAYNDYEKMMLNELLGCINGIQVKDDTMMMIRANYGVGILPSLFGLNCRIINNNMPWVDHLGSEDAILKLIDKGIPDLKEGLGKRVFETNEYYNEVLLKYPLCHKAVHIYHPDLQGPFSVAHLMWGADIYYAFYDTPDLVHSLMKLVTETYIKFLSALKKNINDEENDKTGTYNYHWGTLFKGRLVLRNDSAVNLSREMYEEFVKPYDEQILRAFGGGSIHYCGRADQWIFSMMDCKGANGLNFGQPPNMVFGFEFLNRIYDQAAIRKIPIISYDMSKENILKIFGTKFETGVSFQVPVTNRDEAIDLLKNLKRG